MKIIEIDLEPFVVILKDWVDPNSCEEDLEYQQKCRQLKKVGG